MKPIEYPKHIAGEWATSRAREELQRLGFAVDIPNHTCARGADLHFHIPGLRVQTCEVKLAHWNVGSKAGAWRVNRVTRKKDDYIAFVFPNGRVHFEKMRDHLKLCNASGDRYLTALGRLLA